MATLAVSESPHRSTSFAGPAQRYKQPRRPHILSAYLYWDIELEA